MLMCLALPVLLLFSFHAAISESHRYSAFRHPICDGDVRCAEGWTLKSSWTQGGYGAACAVTGSKELDSNVLIKVFLTRNIYNCSNSTVHAVRIVNNYFDQDGKLCHLAFGEDKCPGMANTGQQTLWIKVTLFCGKHTCQFQYHRCDVCPLVPWYSWTPRRIFHLKRSLSCKDQVTYDSGNIAHGSCLRCDGVLVSRKYCDSEAHGKYFIDLKESKPSWSEWKSTSGCLVRGQSHAQCTNDARSAGIMTWSRFCHYPGHPVRLDPKYCKSNVSDTITRKCNATIPKCSKLVKTNRHDSGSKVSNVWIAIIIIAMVVLVASTLCIYIKYNQLRSHNDKLFTATGIFSSCATQTSPRYSPRRIITEPEYALLGDWRQNVVQCPQPEYKRSYGDPVYWGIEHDQYSDDELHNVESPVPVDARECCELDADSKRALYAKIHRWR